MCHALFSLEPICERRLWRVAPTMLPMFYEAKTKIGLGTHFCSCLPQFVRGKLKNCQFYQYSYEVWYPSPQLSGLCWPDWGGRQGAHLRAQRNEFREVVHVVLVVHVALPQPDVLVTNCKPAGWSNHGQDPRILGLGDKHASKPVWFAYKIT